MILGNGSYRYRVIENWAKLPEGWEFKDVAAVAVDSKDRVYVFNRGEHPMIVFDREGNFLRSWGEGTFPRAHGLHIDANDILYCTDDGGHVVRKCTTEGKVLLELGVPGQPAPYMSGTPFHRCTHTALSPRGDIYVSDGYGNARVHKYSPDGKLLLSWGEPGTDPGQFNIVHNVVTDAEGWVYVADRENHRVQVFDGNGKYETQWVNMHRPCALYCCRGAAPAVRHRRARAGNERQPPAPQHRPATLDRGRERQAARAPRRRERPGPRAGQVHRAARPRARLARRHLRRRGQLYRVPALVPGAEDRLAHALVTEAGKASLTA